MLSLSKFASAKKICKNAQGIFIQTVRSAAVFAQRYRREHPFIDSRKYKDPFSSQKQGSKD